MGAAQRLHVLQVVDWSRFTLEEWLYQVGAWLDEQYRYNTNDQRVETSMNPIAVAMMQAAKKIKVKKIDDAKRGEIISNYILDGVDDYRAGRSKVECLICDEEAQAVKTLVADMTGQSEVLDSWLASVEDRYFRGKSWSGMENKDRTVMDAKFDVRCGLAALHARYPHILKMT